MKHFIGGYEVSLETKIKYERDRSRHLAEQAWAAEAAQKANAKPCRKGWNVVCHCVGSCEKES